jgi:hypothetical protein
MVGIYVYIVYLLDRQYIRVLVGDLVSKVHTLARFTNFSQNPGMDQNRERRARGEERRAKRKEKLRPEKTVGTLVVSTNLGLTAHFGHGS